MQKSWRPLLVTLFVASLALVLGCAAKPIPTNNNNPPAPKLKITETSVCEYPEDGTGVNVSDDMRHVAIIMGHDEGQFVILDGVAGKSYEYIKDIRFSPDCERFAYTAQWEEKFVFVVDGKEGGEYDSVSNFFATEIVFSPDSKRVAYHADRGGKSLVVLDGAEGKEYDDVSWGIVFSPDSMHIAYSAIHGTKWLMVVDGVEGKEYDESEPWKALAFSPDSKRTAYCAKRGDKWVAVVDGVEGKEYDSAYDCRFSSDSKRVAYVASSGDKTFLVVDGKEGTQYDAASDFEFSADFTRTACIAKRGQDGAVDKYEVIIDGVVTNKCSSARELTFSADSKRVACIASYGETECMIVEGVEGKTWRQIGWSQSCWGPAPVNIVFSPDCKHVAYVAHSEGFFALLDTGTFVVIDGVEGKAADEIPQDCIVFSPDSHHVAYIARRATNHDGQLLEEPRVVIDGTEGLVYDYVGDVVFSPDSQHAAYLATRDGNWVVVVDGVESRKYDELANSDKLVFDSPTKLHTLMVRNDEIFLVEIEITE